jgi:peptidyl-Asp metalloendopeptidase
MLRSVSCMAYLIAFAVLGCGAGAQKEQPVESKESRLIQWIGPEIEPSGIGISSHDFLRGEARDLASEQKTILSNILADKGTTSCRIVKIDTALLKSNRVRFLEVPEGKRVQLSDYGIYRSGDGKESDLTWHGTLEDDSKGEAVLTVRDGEVTGTIWTEGQLYYIRSLGNGINVLVKVNADAFPPEHPKEHEEGSENNPSTHDIRNADPPIECVESPMSSGISVIKVLVLFTESAKSQAAGKGVRVEALLDTAFEETNRGFSRSGVRARVENVGVKQTDYRESGSISRDVDRFASRGDGYTDEVHDDRDNLRADIAILLVDEQEACGIAKTIGAKEDDAYAVVLWSCATGYYSFGHEMGHLLSARHNPEEDSTTRPFSNGHGYLDPKEKFRTIMAYDCPSHCPRKLQWSNPNIKLLGEPTGTQALHYDACVLNKTVPIVAQFR